MSAPPLVIVAAMGANGVIGRDGGLPFRLPSDLKRFRALTMGSALVMGRKTFQSIGKPLPGRHSVVLSRDPAFADAMRAYEAVTVARDLEQALSAARAQAERMPVRVVHIVGGARIYAQALDCADRLTLTRVALSPEGDARFPDFDPARWREASRCEHSASPGDEAAATTIVYEARKEAL